jgi:peptidoglycan hydrolase-like protein with peptidoglycan-binding domain
MYNGMPGPDNNVATWQNRMRITYGYLYLAGDGWFGPSTDYVTRDFQSKHGLAVDGIVGPATWAKA